MTESSINGPAGESTTDSIFLIDASIYIFQAYFSPHVECYGSQGQDLSAVFGFTQFLFQFLRRVKPRYAAVARDESLQTGFRHRLYGDYKSNRELPDDNLKMQLDGCSLIAQSLGLADFASEEFEADDILGTLCRKSTDWVSEDAQICILSRDKDLAQLLFNDSCVLWDFSSNKKRFSHDIKAEYGVRPEQFPDYLGLIGDAVDMIKGVPGVGPVKAKALLDKYDSLEGVYANLGELHSLPIRGAKGLGQLLLPHSDLARLSKLLATIRCDVTDERESFSNVGLPDLSVQSINESMFSQTLSSLDFGESQSDRLKSQLSRVIEAIV